MKPRFLRRCALPLFGILLYAASLAAQTLQNRPAAQPALPAASPALAAPIAPELPAGTVLQVEIPRNYPMKAGEAIEGRLVDPLYVNGKLAVAANTPVRGVVTALAPDGKTRVHARLRGDFTPFHIAEVRFNQIVLPNGPMPFTPQGTTTGAPLLRLAAAGVPKHSFVRRVWDQQISDLHNRISFFTAPGLGDRALQMLYHQLPYHPERIPAHTAWTFELADPLPLSAQALVNDPAAAAPATPGQPEIWRVHALLTAHVTSANAKPGDSVEALVVEPVYDAARQLVVPQGSTLVGRVTVAKAARSFGRNGRLRFSFQEVRFPPGTMMQTPKQQIDGSLGGATAQSPNGLSMDAEGTVTPKSQASAIAPLFLTVLAGRALDQDGNLYGNNTVASNGFGLIGRVVGIAAGNRNIAAGLGFYAASLSAYENFLRPGHDVDFPKDTRIEIETTPLRSPVLKPEGK